MSKNCKQHIWHNFYELNCKCLCFKFVWTYIGKLMYYILERTKRNKWQKHVLKESATDIKNCGFSFSLDLQILKNIN